MWRCTVLLQEVLTLLHTGVWSQKEERHRSDVRLTLVCKSILFILIIYPTLFLPQPFPSTPPPQPVAFPGHQLLSVTIANQSSPAERRQPNKEEQKKKPLLSVCFFLLNSNKYIEMQWFLLYPFFLSSRIKKFSFLFLSVFIFIDLSWIFSSNSDRLSWWLAAQRGGAVWRRNTTRKVEGVGEKWGKEGDPFECQQGISVLPPSLFSPTWLEYKQCCVCMCACVCICLFVCVWTRTCVMAADFLNLNTVVSDLWQSFSLQPQFGVKWRDLAPLFYLFITFLLSRLKQQQQKNNTQLRKPKKNKIISIKTHSLIILYQLQLQQWQETKTGKKEGVFHPPSPPSSSSYPEESVSSCLSELWLCV